MIERDSVIIENRKLREESGTLPDTEREPGDKADSLKEALANLLKENNNLKRDIEQLKSSLGKTNGDYKGKFIALQSDYNSLLGKFESLTKNCEDYDKLRSAYNELKSNYEELRKKCVGYENLKNSNSNLQKKLKDFEKKLGDCEKKLQDCQGRIIK
jgi:uncharacterized coiled-coil DUF342 family protein